MTTFPWLLLGPLLTVLVGGLIFSNLDMLENNDDYHAPKPKEEKCRDRRSCL